MLAIGLMTAGLAVGRQAMAIEPRVSTVVSPFPVESMTSARETSVPDPKIEPSEQIDPLDSPHPIPWQWVMDTYQQVSSTTGSGVRYYRSPSLVSPDGQYAVYSRIEMQVQPQLYHCQVSSVMFVENLKTGDLQTIIASSPIALYQGNVRQEEQIPGTIAILMPVSWNPTGDQVLAREFEALFSTSDMSDYAVIWDSQQNRTSTLAPTDIEYEQAILLGWSQTYPGRVLFKAGHLGDRVWPLWAIDVTGKTIAATHDQPIVFGNTMRNIWGGPQFHW